MFGRAPSAALADTMAETLSIAARAARNFCMAVSVGEKRPEQGTAWRAYVE